MLGMFILKRTYGLSDEQVWYRWVHDFLFPALHRRRILPTRSAP
ncbi:MAG: hypothetical protein HOK21_03015 [Rhodospirillaceae bacterium]|nr:hypothetical protein [Rhodospirillaceae bacterium]MBT5881737.1 hypothetical protein [Rhodospirillaceae bacterium]